MKSILAFLFGFLLAIPSVGFAAKVGAVLLYDSSKPLPVAVGFEYCPKVGDCYKLTTSNKGSISAQLPAQSGYPYSINPIVDTSNAPYGAKVIPDASCKGVYGILQSKGCSPDSVTNTCARIILVGGSYPLPDTVNFTFEYDPVKSKGVYYFNLSCYAG